MKISRLLFASLVLLLAASGCSKKTETTTIPDPIRPALMAKREYLVGEKIELAIKWPPSEWQWVGSQEKTIDSGEFWPWYIRVNGKDYRLTHGLMPFRGLGGYLDLNDHLRQGLQWTPGEYRVQYILKGIRVCHPKAPQYERYLEEWTSNEIAFQVVEAGKS